LKKKKKIKIYIYTLNFSLNNRMTNKIVIFTPSLSFSQIILSFYLRQSHIILLHTKNSIKAIHLIILVRHTNRFTLSFFNIPSRNNLMSFLMIILSHFIQNIICFILYSTILIFFTQNLLIGLLLQNHFIQSK
jgi:hypothetical protein